MVESKNFTEAFNKLLDLEGGYSNHAKDLGGATNFGITEKLARSFGYLGDMRNLNVGDAKTIYWKAFWSPMGLEYISGKNKVLGDRLFDMGVNCGAGRAITWLQISLNALNLQEAKYADIAEDGGWGPKTKGAFDTFMLWRGAQGGTVLIKAVTCLQGHHYIDISRRRPDNEEFVYGWLNRRISFT